MRILVAEDDTTTRTMLHAILSKWGYDVISASDGEKAWSILQHNETLELAIVDWEMPGMNGLALCHNIKSMELESPIYVILLTSRGNKLDIVHGLDAGADDYVIKPFDNGELRARVRVAERMISIQKTLAEKVGELKDTLKHVKMLQGIIPICMYCHKIQNDSQAWDQMEAYIHQHSDAKFSHSICPDCLKKNLAELDRDEENSE